ncbi:hypothetical protein [Dysgonomonas reticulitermitis]
MTKRLTVDCRTSLRGFTRSNPLIVNTLDCFTLVGSADFQFAMTKRPTVDCRTSLQGFARSNPLIVNTLDCFTPVGSADFQFAMTKRPCLLITVDCLLITVELGVIFARRASISIEKTCNTTTNPRRGFTEGIHEWTGGCPTGNL